MRRFFGSSGQANTVLKRYRLRLLVLTLLILFAVGGEAAAQNDHWLVNITGIDSRAFPQVTTYVTVQDENGLPVTGLTAADFTVFEDGVQIPPSDITVENVAISGLYLVLAIDLSTPDPNLPAVKEAAKTFVDALQPVDKLALIAFYDEVTLLADFTNNRDALKTAIDSLSYKGNWTALNEVMNEAASLLGRFSTGRKGVILLPDIKNNIGTLSLSQAVSAVQAAKTPLYIVSFREKAQPGDFDNISAQIVGASSVVFPSVESVQARLLEIGQQLRQGYRLTYRSPLTPDNASHNVLAQLSGGQAEGNYVAVSNEVRVIIPGLSDGQTVAGVVNLTALVTAPAPVASVQYLLDGSSLQTGSTPPYSFDWDTTFIPAGPHTLTARAVDSAGNQGQTSAALNVTSPLVVTIVSSTDEVNLGDTVLIQAQIESIVEVTQVDLLLDGQALNTDKALPASFAISSTQYEAGAHTVAVQAVNSQGFSAKDTVTLQFLPLPPAPPSKLWWRLKLLLAFMVVALALTFLLLLLLLLRHRRPQPQQYALALFNQGNAPSQYKLRAEEPLGLLQFAFLMNGYPLPVEQVAGPYQAGRGQTVAATGGYAGQPGPQTQSAKRGAGGRLRPSQPLDQAQQKLSGLSGCLTPFLTLFSVISSFLPGSMGQSIQRSVNEIGSAQSKAAGSVSLAQTNVKMTEQAVKGAGGQMASMQPAPPTGGGEGSMAPGPAAAGAAVAAPIAPPPATGISIGPQPAAGPVWTLTPVVDPQQTLSVDLQITPLDPKRTRQYEFRVISKLVNQATLPAIVEAGHIQVRGASWFSNLLRVVLFLLVAVAVIYSTGYLVFWLLEITPAPLPILSNWLG